MRYGRETFASHTLVRQLAISSSHSLSAEARNRHSLPTWTAGMIPQRAFVRNVLGWILKSLAASATSSNGSKPVSTSTRCACFLSSELTWDCGSVLASIELAPHRGNCLG